MDSNIGKTDWRCKCGRLLGKRQGQQIHIHIGDRHRYIVDGKVTCVCPNPQCGALNSEQTAEIVTISTK